MQKKNQNGTYINVNSMRNKNRFHNWLNKKDDVGDVGWPQQQQLLQAPSGFFRPLQTSSRNDREQEIELYKH